MWTLPELYVLRELVHVAINKTPIASDVQVDPLALQHTAHGEERICLGASSSASFSSTATSATPPSDSSFKKSEHQQQLKMLLNSALVHSKRFYFVRRADLRLRLTTRRQFVRLFPLLARVSKPVQYALFEAFDANDTGKIEFEELCEMLAKMKRARGSSVREMAELAFTLFQSGAVLTYADIKLLAMTVVEIGGDCIAPTDLATSLTKLVLGRGQNQVTRATFCEEMDCELGARVLRVLLAPFDIVKTLLNEKKILHKMSSFQWKAGDTAYAVSKRWWTQWRQYVKSDLCHPLLQQNETHESNGNQCEQETDEQLMQEGNAEQQQQSLATECHPRPGPITNREICANERLGTLRRGLVIDEDCVLVPSSVWKRLVQVYGGGPEFPRHIVSVVSPEEVAPGEEETRANKSTSKKKKKKQQQQVTVDLYPVALQVRLARHDARQVYLVYARRFLLPRASTLKEIMHRMGIFPGFNAREVTLWIRRHRLQAWTRLECNLEASDASLEGLQITSAQELLVDFRATNMEVDPQSIAQEHRRSSTTRALSQAPFNVAMLQPVGNDFVCCSAASLAKFARTGDWRTFRPSMALNQGIALYGPSGSGDGLLAKQMEGPSKMSRGRLVAHVGIRATGLLNMGNTCFMNSALQCLVHSPVFREYFLSNRFEPDVNKKNRLGSRGAIAAAYARLQTALWRERNQSYLLPGEFRDEFTRVRSHFEETRQYDAHEFMVALLDCLHEDLNQGHRTVPASLEDIVQEKSSGCLSFSGFHGVDDLVKGDESLQAPQEKPSDEVQGDTAWREYTSVNSSVVVDLFHGQMRSETVCATCGERKCTFDPNLFFSLPIPELDFVRVDVSVQIQARKLPNDADDDSNMALRTEQRGFWLHRGSNVDALCDRIATVYGRASGSRFLLAEVRRNCIKRIVEGNELVDQLATAVSGSLAAYERAWTLAEIPVVPAIIAEYFNDHADHSTKEAADTKAQSFSDLRVGSRVDAKDSHNDWHTGTVIDVDGSHAAEEEEMAKHHQRVCVHFDAFSSKWDKWFTAHDWESNCLQPLHVRTSKSTEVFEVQVVHRFVSHPEASDVGQTKGDDPIGDGAKSQEFTVYERPFFRVFGTPLFVTIASDKSAQDMHQALLLQTARFWRTCRDDPKWLENNQDDDLKQIKLPYEVRVVNLENLASELGELLPIDSSALLQHFSSRSVLALDWTDYHDYASHEVRVSDDAPVEVIESTTKTNPDLHADLKATPFHNEKTDKTPDEGLAMDDDSPPKYAVPLAQCMDALMREEAISLEDHWVCERCGVPREGTRLSAIWRLPDLVMIQLKRFQYLENQHKQKVRALVDFPLKGFDFSKWMGHQDEANPAVYDLYAVANHVGGLTRGHYTAYCCYDADFPESFALFQESNENLHVQCPELWFRFDDDKVSEIAAGDVVTDAAYVLFYKRQILSSHNVLRYAL